MQKQLETIFQRAASAHQAGHLQEAFALYQAVLADNPKDFVCLDNLGVLFADLGQIEQALGCYQMALQFNPRYAMSLAHIGELHYRFAQYQEAVSCFRRALPHFRQQTQLRCKLGIACARAGDEKQAIIELENALLLEPGNAEARTLLADVLLEEGQLDRAETLLLQNCQSSPGNLGETLNNLAVIALERNALEDATSLLQRALTEDPSLIKAHWNLALAKLTAGDLHGGFAEYGFRFAGQEPAVHSFADKQLPYWQFDALHDKTLYIYGEQGIGDELFFALALPWLIPQCGNIILGCDKKLLRLFSKSFPEIRCVDQANPGPLDGVDCQTALGSLFAHTAEHHLGILSRKGYLKCAPQTTTQTDTRKRIGYCLQAGSRKREQRKRSIPRAVCQSWLSLPHNFIDLQSSQSNLDALAAVISTLDLVITADNTTAHLAACLGIPVWICLPTATDWRWQLTREDSPYYATARLLRQNDAGNWLGPMQAIEKGLCPK